MLAAWVLVVTGVYVGMLDAPFEVKVRFNATMKTEKDCNILKDKLVHNLVGYGAQNIKADCNG